MSTENNWSANNIATKYFVIEAVSTPTLVDEVNSFLRRYDNWTTLGGPTYVSGRWYQAMTRRK